MWAFFVILIRLTFVFEKKGELYFEELDCKHVNYVLVYAIDILFVHVCSHVNTSGTWCWHLCVTSLACGRGYSDIMWWLASPRGASRENQGK